jgi:hypothetical protein
VEKVIGQCHRVIPEAVVLGAWKHAPQWARRIRPGAASAGPGPGCRAWQISRGPRSWTKNRGPRTAFWRRSTKSQDQALLPLKASTAAARQPPPRSPLLGAERLLSKSHSCL